MSSIAASRVESALRDTIGPELSVLLKEDGVTDVLLNEDGHVWVDKVGAGRYDTGIRMGQRQAMSVLRLLADFCKMPLVEDSPLLLATIPTSGERVSGTIPPISSAPTFSIRKPPPEALPLDRFSDDPGILRQVVDIVDCRINAVISGSTGSGKTSLLSSMISLESVTNRRVVCLEANGREVDLRKVPDHVRLLASLHVGLDDLVSTSLTMRPDLIVVGEIRSGVAARDWVNACNTGHDGSMATIHASSARNSIRRLDNLCNQVCPQSMLGSIEDAVGCVIFTARSGDKRQIREVLLR